MERNESMAQEELRSQLIMKDVAMEDIHQFDELLRYVFQITQTDLDDSGYEEGELLRAKRPILKNAQVIGWYHDDQLVSQIAIYPSEVNIFNKIFKMGGVTGVGTYPEYSNMGLMKELIVESLKRMRDNKQYISYLYPYSIPYYRKKGWELISDRLSFKISDTQLQVEEIVNGQVKRCSIDDADVGEIYRKFSLQTHGTLIRNDFYWDEYWRWENEEERIAAIYYDENDVAQGYLIYWIAKEVMHVKEIVTLSNHAWNGLWNFIVAHDSMVDEVRGFQYINDPLSYKILDGYIKEIIEPYYMARIVDVEEFLKLYPFKETGFSFHIKVSDPLATWNERIFGIEWENEAIKISDQAVGEKLETDIGTLTTMLMGYKRPIYLYRNERIQCSKKLADKLETIIYDEKPYFSDYF